MAQQRRPAGGGQIPLDDEPMDIDLGDLPSEAEFAEAETEGATAPEEGEPGAVAAAGVGALPEQSLLALFQLWVTLVALAYFLIGAAVGLIFAFRGAAEAGLSALTHPGFYLIVLFWPIALWKLFFNQF